MILHLDFETRSTTDLKKEGLYNYAQDPFTDIICAAYAFDDAPVRLWVPGDHLPGHVRGHIQTGGEVHAHNAAFERELTNNVAAKKYGWPKIKDEQLVCTMAMAYAMGLPGYLEGAAAALGVDQQKDMVGSRLMRQYCEPKHFTPDGAPVWWDNPDDLNRIYQYCIQDVEVERAIGKRMMMLSPYEREVWLLDQKINARGIKVDIMGAGFAAGLVDREKERLNEEIRQVSGNQIATCTAVQQIKDYLYLQGVPGVESLAKADVAGVLALDSLPVAARKVLELRREAGKASTAKLTAMVARASREDHRLRGNFQYSGAGTRRWAGRGVQLQNLPRSKIKHTLVDKLITDISNGRTANEIDICYGPPLDVVSSCLRGFLCSDWGHDLLACDFSSIEARVIAWLAGQENVLEIFKTHGKIYEHAAGNIFGVGIDDVDEMQRQIGKVAVLALGYQGGVGALQTMARGYGVRLDGCFGRLWSLADHSQRERCESNFKTNRNRYEISREEFIASDLTKTFWRESNSAIVRFWDELGQAAIRAVQYPGTKQTAREISYKTSGSFLWCRLPSGGVLCYPYPKIEKKTLPWGGEADTLTYMSEDGQSKKWMRFQTYGGSLAENVTQAVARDLLADAMLRLERQKYPIVAHVHDEIVCEVKEHEGSLEQMSRIMCEVPAWAKGLPIKAGGWRGKRYRK